MSNVLVPVDGSANSLNAVKHVIRLAHRQPPITVHLLNVRPAFHRHIAQFLSRDQIHVHHREQGTRALDPAIALLDRAAVPYRTYIQVGDKAEIITQFAAQHGCALIVLGTTRKSSLLRMIEDSTTNRVIELAEVPMQIVPGDRPSMLERVGIPAAIGLGLTLLFLADE